MAVKSSHCHDKEGITMAEVKISAVEFGKYLALQGSGITNMFDINMVMFRTGLSKAKIVYIMKHYSDLCEKYNK